MNRNIYISNMQLFEKSFPGISEIIENCRNSIEKETEVYFEQAADGNKIIKVKKEDRQLYFSGKREPADKARIEIEKWGKIDKHAVVFVTGLGDIAFLKQLVIKIVPSIQLVIYEPSLNVFFKVIENIDLSFLFEDRIPALIVDGLNGEEKKAILEKLVTLANIEFIKHYENRSCAALFSAQVIDFMKLLGKTVEDVIVGRNTGIRYSAVEMDNLFHNIKYLCEGSITTQLCDIIPTDIPAIIVSAGPSLNKNIMELKRAKNKAFIVAVDTAVRPLVNAGIIPDMYVIVDGLKPKELLDFDEAKRIPLMPSITSTKEILENHTGKKIFWFEGQRFIWSMMMMNGVPFSTVACGGSVACSAFSLVYKLGFSRIILVGQDLALTGNKTHADGTFKSIMDEIDTSRCIKVPGNYEEEVPTRGDFKLYLDWFNYYIKGCEGIHVINATEGGAKIDNTEIMTLHDAIMRECIKEVDIDACFEKLKPIFNAEQQHKALEYLKTFPEMYRKLKKKVIKLNKEYQKLKTICGKSIIDKNAYLKALKNIKNLTQEIENHELYDTISCTLTVANYIIESEQFYEEDTVAAEGLQIAKQGIAYTKMVEQCIDLFMPLTEETLLTL
ncbi:MAG: motility associated factor glycosyltransferase family protein [Roseburia inulinivorans]|jgi:hypothetical protein